MNRKSAILYVNEPHGFPPIRNLEGDALYALHINTIRNYAVDTRLLGLQLVD